MSEVNWVNVAVAVVALIVMFFLFGANTKKSEPVKLHKPKDGKFTKEEVAKHNTKSSCWIIVDGSVYDVTEYIEEVRHVLSF
jgi:cytochrome b involved in lipid metabolism